MIKWINEEMGTAAYDNAVKQLGITIIDTRILVDKEGNDLDVIKKIIDEAILKIKKEKKIVICCDYGMSRSNAIAAGVLALRKGIPINDAVSMVLSATGEKNIRVEVLHAVRQAVEVNQKKISYNDKRVLVTGSGGFIGEGLVGKMQNMNMCVFTPKSSEIDLTEDIVKLDLFIKNHSINTIVHLANPRIYTTNASFGLSLSLLKNVLDLSLLNKLYFIHISCWVVYSGYRGSIYVDENYPLMPKGTYGQAKALGESLVKMYRLNGLERSLILRVSNIYGKVFNRPRFLWNFIKKATKGEEVLTHNYLNGLSGIDLLHINDFHQALLMAINAELVGDYNIGSGCLVNTKLAAETIINKIQSESQVSHININDYTGNIMMDYTKLKHAINWQPKIVFKDGIAEIIELGGYNK